MQKEFHPGDDWYREESVRDNLNEYYRVFQSVLTLRPELQEGRVACRDCEIEFLTHPRNYGRIDLRCPFGCRQHHRREASTRRSAAYYSDPMGKLKKKRRNERRRQKAQDAVQGESPSSGLDKTMMRYLQSTLGMIEGRKITEKEIHAILEKRMSQHSIANDKESDYGDGQEREKAP